MIIGLSTVTMKLRALRGCTWVYVIGWQERGPTKIGVAGHVACRRNELQVGNPYPLKVFDAFAFAEKVIAFEVENAVLKSLRARRLKGEWMEATAAQVSAEIEAYCLKRQFHPQKLNGLSESVRREMAKARKQNVKERSRAQAAMAENRWLNR